MYTVHLLKLLELIYALWSRVLIPVLNIKTACGINPLCPVNTIVCAKETFHLRLVLLTQCLKHTIN